MTEANATRITIRALAHGGAGVGAAAEEDGPTWFVPGTLPGEDVLVTLQHDGKRFRRGRLLDVVNASPDRVVPPCPYVERCGGCDWQHVRPGAQGLHKRSIVADQLRKIVDPERVRLAFTGPEQAYRRRVRVHYAQTETGFHLGFLAEGTHELVDIPVCLVLDPPLRRALDRLRSVSDALPKSGQVFAVSDGQGVVLGLPGVRPSPEEDARWGALLGDPVVGIEFRGGRQRHALGTSSLLLDGGGAWPPLRTGPFDFAQAQSVGSLALVREVSKAARAEGRRVLELYAGNGNFTRALARTAARVWASDSDRDAMDALRGLAKANDLPINAKRQNAPRLLGKLAGASIQYDVVVLDPPRAGVGVEAMRDACRVAQERIVYVSCDPATLARDLTAAKEQGFSVHDVAVLDLMPMTSNVEIVCTLLPAGGRG